MQKIWKILAVCLATTLLMSALFVTVAAEGLGENDPPTGDIDNPISPDQPNEPENPDQPNEPENPDQPDEPENPDQPDEPENPDQPDEPENPDQPDKPENPDQPDEPENPTGEPSTNPSDEPTGDPIAPRPTYTDPIAPIRPTKSTETTDSTTSTAPTESVTVPSHSAPLWPQASDAQTPTKPAVKEDAKEEEFPFDVRTTVIYSLVALVIMVAGGVAIYIITKHKSNPQQRH